MRSILNISLQPGEKKEIAKRAKKAGMTISGYIIYAVKLEEHLISQEELLAMAEKAERDYRGGRTTELKTLADFMRAHSASASKANNPALPVASRSERTK